MEYRLLGKTGVYISPLGLGTMNFGNPSDEETSSRILDRAIDAGINLIDTANVYAKTETETILGKAFKRNGRRNSIFLASKAHGAVGAGPNDRGTSRYHLMQACEDSLRRLQTDHLDLYQMHRPYFEAAPEETLSALNDLVRQGKVRYIGTSAHPAWFIMEGLAVSERYGWARYVSEQPPYNLLDRRSENEVIPLCQRHGLAVFPFSPLGGGSLAGRYRPNEAPPADSRLAAKTSPVQVERLSPTAIATAQKVAALAERRGLTVAQFALLWCKDQPGITAPLIGPRTLEQLEGLLPVLEMHLTPEDRAALDEINPPGSVIVNFHNSAPWMKMRLP